MLIERDNETKDGTDWVLDTLYSHPIPSTRTGHAFNAHSYPTKINAEAILPFILAHTQPGDLVFDGFAGSGATGLAIALCSKPSQELRARLESFIGRVAWGERRGVLYDISTLATFIGTSLLDPPDPEKFGQAAKEVLTFLANKWGWMYHALDDTGGTGTIRYTLWTDYPICRHCGTQARFWDLAVSLSPLRIASQVTCPSCNIDFEVPTADRVIEEYVDDLLSEPRKRRLRSPAFVYGSSGKSLWKRPASGADFELLERINDTHVPQTVPIVPMLSTEAQRWGELYRSGYHSGITHLHHFYTRRNLIAVAAAWEAADSYPTYVRDALRFWISSYNSSHSTLMTRVVCKEGAKEFVVTSAQPAALYISSLPVEKNVFAGLAKKFGVVKSAFAAMSGRGNHIEVKRASCLDVHMPDSSVDFIFTDPPFGNNIQYAEVNFISEAWLGNTTDSDQEVIVSPHQGKSDVEYGVLLTGAFVEAFRILKPGHYMTVVFHSTKPGVWGALRTAWQSAGFYMIRSTVLDKKQASFKQTTTDGAVSGDPIILLQKPVSAKLGDLPHQRADVHDIVDPWRLITARLLELGKEGDNLEERTRQRLYGYLVTECLKRAAPVPIAAGKFFSGLDQHFERVGPYYFTQ